MNRRAAVTVYRPREEVERLWHSSEYRPDVSEGTELAVSFATAPGDRGTEIHVELRRGARGGRLGELTQRLRGTVPLAKIKDELRRFKQHAETGVIVRSEGSPEGERAERKLKHRPAQPLEDSELEKASG